MSSVNTGGEGKKKTIWQAQRKKERATERERVREKEKEKEKKREVTKALSNVVRTASRIYPRAKVITSSLLPRRDVPQRIINAINVEIAKIFALIPNVHIANHQQVKHQHLYDHIHIHRESMRLFAKTIKASTLNNPQKTHREESWPVSQQLRRCSGTTRQIRLRWPYPDTKHAENYMW